MHTQGWVKEARVPDSDIVFRSNVMILCVSMTGREPASDCSREQNTALPWGRGHVHPCCRLCFDKQATAPSHPSLHPCRRQHGHRLPTICSWVCGTAKIRYTRRTSENNVTQVLCHQHADTYTRPHMFCEMTTKTPLFGLPSSPFSNMMVSPFMPSTSSLRSPFPWTCDRSCDTRNTTPQSVPCLDSCHKARLGRTAPTTARTRRGRARERQTPGSHSPSGHDGRRQRDDLLLHHSLALQEVRQDCHGDNVLLDNVLLLRCVERRMVGVGRISSLYLLQNTNDLTAACSSSQHFEISDLATLRESWLSPPKTRTCLNFIHFDIQIRNQDIWLTSMRVQVTPAVHPRMLEILTTLTFGALRKKSHCANSHSRPWKKHEKIRTVKPRRPSVVSHVS